MEKILESFREQARRAHSGTSFSPEKRGDSVIESYSQQLSEDLETIKALNGDAEYYQTKYKKLFSAWLSAKSRCLSAMITGPSGFNSRRNDKANDSEHKRYGEFFQWRDMYLARVAKMARKEARKDIDPLQEQKDKLAKLEAFQLLMVESNKIIRSKKLMAAEKIEGLVGLGISEEASTLLLEKDSCGRIGFASYQLTNNNAKIKFTQGQIKVLESKAKLQTKSIEKEGGITITQNIEADRLQIFFPGKPEPEMISRLKSAAFKWAPSVGCWQRQLTRNAMDSLQRVFPKES